ncbi:hypothetical protein HD597_000132 [Nonomuraea thailandensis]|uniref:Uncharacterized protein n=1 Tax=Nonomuraea thailandensis TaxID=1188745 RepID=A0A9X2G8R2_9ACTN|nr:hypothetical protein [Nonomuraea thailandensis]MCP2353112.1 hypothetical protein [Nonomuraea thailandensis]
MRNIRDWKRPALAGVALGLGAVMLLAAPAGAVAGTGNASSVSAECGGMPYNGQPCG